MEDIQYVSLIETGSVVIEIWGVENGDLSVPVNNTLVCYTSLLATDMHMAMHCKTCGVIYDTVMCLSHQIWSGYHFHSVIYYTNSVISTLHFLQCGYSEI